MASSKPSKRPYPDSDSDSDPLPTTFPNFIVLESLDEKQLTKLNPIVIEKTISGIVKPISVKNLTMAHYSLRSTGKLMQTICLR